MPGYLGLSALVALASLSATSHAEQGMRIPTSAGWVSLDEREAETYQLVDRYLSDRMREVESVRPGATFEEMAVHFRRDGGLSSPPPHRFVHVLCPYIKVHVSFEGESAGEAFRRIPPKAKIASISRPFLDYPYTD